MASKKFSWGLKHTIISAIAVAVIGGGLWIYLAGFVAPEQAKVSNQAACQSFAAIVKDATTKDDLSTGVGLLIKGAAGSAKIAAEGSRLSKELATLGAMKLEQLDLTSADTATQFGARIQLINELCTTEFN